MISDDPITIGGHALDGIIRRVRRRADFSQRELAKFAKVSPALVAGVESGTVTPSLATLQRLLHAANYQLVVVDVSGRLVLPLEVWDDVTDLAGRRFPAHLDTILDPEFGEWWADGYGLARPPETFRRNRAYRDYQRRTSRWLVRVAQLRYQPPPRLPHGFRAGDEWRGAKPPAELPAGEPPAARR
jgi:transcriptional regulator with XRE-family HTH domain